MPIRWVETTVAPRIVRPLKLANHCGVGDRSRPACRKGLGQDASSADENGIAFMIAGDPSKHRSLAAVPIVITTSGTCSGGASWIDGDQPNAVFRRLTVDPPPDPPATPRRGDFAEALASGSGCSSLQFVQVFEAVSRDAAAIAMVDGEVGDGERQLAMTEG
jgi:hypothetical protein